MFSKKFTNNAAQPMEIEVIAAVNHEGIITRILASGGIAGSTDDQRAEAMRMFSWAKATFVGQDIVMLQSHNGVVPSPIHVPHLMPGSPRLEDLAFGSDAYARMAEFFNVPFKSIRETAMPEILGAAFRPSRANFYHASGDADFRIDGVRFVVLDDINPEAIAEALLTTPGALDAIMSGLKEEELTGKPQEVNIELRVDTDGATETLDALVKALRSPPKWAEGIQPKGVNSLVYSKNYDVPKIDTYWQSRIEPTKFYRVHDVHPCIGHHHLELHCLQDGSYDSQTWASASQWADLFTQVDRDTAHAPLSPQSSVGPHARPVGRLTFPNLLKPEYEAEAKFVAEADLHPHQADAVQRVLDGVEFTGKELPPKEGEQYQRVDRDDVFTVRSVVLEDFGLHKVLMENEDGSMRVKVAYRNHAQWLTHWRPVDSNGEVKPVTFVDIENDDKEVLAEVREGMIEENAERWIRVIGRELDRRVPGWRDYDPPGVLYDDCALILRAIRTLNRHMLNYQTLGKELSERTNGLVADAQRDQKRLTELTTWINEMTRDASVAFKNTFGIEKTKELLKEFGYANVMSIPLSDRVSWVRKLREYAGRAGVL
ncbi:hypothetical protein CPT_Suzuki_016 [Stenotrophomonas phage Suzuki]|nr:hypothetical protein CPT_Suzuki_016 [Stenotrophomonas phage Suzuki]